MPKRVIGDLEREELLNRYRRSGLSRKEFSAEAGVSVTWLNKYLGPARSVTASFIEIPRSAPSVGVTRVELEFPDGTKLRVG